MFPELAQYLETLHRNLESLTRELAAYKPGIVERLPVFERTGIETGFVGSKTPFAGFGGIHFWLRAEKAATFTIQQNEAQIFFCNATGGAITANLPLLVDAIASPYIWPVWFVKTDASVNAVTLDGAGAETINGVGTLTLAAQYDKALIVPTAAGWIRLV